MSNGLIWFICLAPLIPVLTIVVVGFLNYRENPLYVRAQLNMLTVGQVKRNKLSSQDKDGCIIYVVKAIEGKKIICDTYIKKGGKYVIDRTDWELKAKEFFDFTDPEPVYKDERIK